MAGQRANAPGPAPGKEVLMHPQANARRSYGTGNLRLRRGSWYGQWWIGGRRVQRKLGPKREPGSRDGLTRKQAEAELRRRIEATEAPSPGRITSVKEAGERLVRTLEVQGRKASTLAAYESTLRVHLVPFFGDQAITRITTEDVDAFVAACRARGCAPKSIRNYLGTLHGIFQSAKVRPNPVTDARKPEAEDADPDIRFLSDAELEALLGAVPEDHLGPTDRTLYLTAAFTGLRQGELFGLRWRDVDWIAMRIRVRRSFARKRAGREAQFGRPKSKRSSRSVPMHDRVGQALERHYQASNYQADDDLVFCHPHTGGPLDSSNVLARFKDALAAAGVRRLRFHDLRHTFGTQMAAAGVPMRTLQEWLGHRDIKTTMIYADYQASEQERELVERAFAGTNSGTNLSESEHNSEQDAVTEDA
jgi:integrase